MKGFVLVASQRPAALVVRNSERDVDEAGWLLERGVRERSIGPLRSLCNSTDAGKERLGSCVAPPKRLFVLEYALNSECGAAV